MAKNKKHNVKCWIIVNVLVVLYKDAFAEITMLPKEYTVVENAGISFTCKTYGQTPTTWSFTTRSTLSYINSGCRYNGDLLDTSQYGCSCPDEYTLNITVKRLTRKDHNRIWSCENNVDFNRAVSTTFVNVTVTEVNLTVMDNTSNGIVQAPENTSIEILCTSSFARPTANITLFGYTNGSDHTPLAYFRLDIRHENDVDNLTQTKHVYTLNVSRSFNEWFLYCTSNNLNISSIVSGVVQLDVLYPPNGPPVIQNFENGTTYKILETHIGKLVCSIVPSNPQSVLTWECESDNWNTNVTSINQTSKVIQWTAQRYTFTRCVCMSEYRFADNMVAVVNIDTLFPVNITHIYLNDTEYHGDIEQLAVIENSTLRLEYIAEGNPQPNISWFGQRERQSVLTLTDINRNQTHNQYLFIASNVIQETEGIATVAVVNRSFSLNVMFPPSVKSLENISVIEGKSLTISCEITPGNPGNTSIRWINTSTDQQFGNDSLLFIARLNRSHTDGFICEASNTMVPTFGKMEHGIHSERYYIDVLFPPEMITITSNYEPNHDVVDTINIIENTYLKIVCTAKSNPSPSAYSWSGLNTSSTSELILYSTRNRHGNITCSAMNRMTEIVSNTTTTTIGTLNRTYFLNVLFPPDINILHDEGLKEGDDITIICSITSGKTTQSKIYWLTKNGTELHNTSLTIRHLTRNETGNYTCQVKYSMEPTYGDKTNGSRKQVFYLDVHYIPEITSFFVQHHEHLNNLTVNENDTVQLACIVDSNPSSTMSISFNDTTNVKEIRKQEETKTLYHDIYDSSCTDTGIYTCTGSNSVSKPGQPSRRHIILYVECAPRESSAMETERNISIDEHESTTFSYSVFAYPKPSFNLYRNNGLHTVNASYWTHHLSNKLFVEWTITYKLQNVPASVYGRYTLRVNNSNGEIIRSFFISPKVTVMNPPSSSVVGPAVGGTVGGVLAIVVIVLAIIVFRRRRLQKVPKDDNKTHEYQNMNFMEDAKRHKRLPPVPIEDVNDIPDRQHNQTHHVEETRSEINTKELKIQQKLNEVTKHPKYQNINLIEDIKHTRLHPVRIENGHQEHQINKVDDSRDHLDSKTKKMHQKKKEHSEYENMNLTKDAYRHTRLPPMIPTEDAYEVPDQVDHVYDSGDQNQMELLDIIHTISLSDLLSYVTSKTAEDYFQEYGRFPQGMISTIPYTFSRRPQNAPLNRYQGIYPYDHSRVVISGEPDFFINANYIDGHSKERAYIASLGPTVRHCLGFQTFWKMVWNEKSDVIVMLTNLQEPSGMKCEKYWADYGSTREVGEFTIQSVTEDIAAEYTVRTFNVSKKGESRSVTQLHYTAWPDKKVPEDVTSLIEFWQRVKAAPTRSLGPLVVHCSAGIGRTGTYLALDRLFEEGKSTGSVNVFDCVMSMRQQRVNMVQTQDQYVYLHQALVYCLVFDTEPVTADTIEEYVQTTSHNVYIKLFEQLKQSVEVESTYEEEARTRNCDDDERNRTQADIPGDAHRIRLFLDKESDESDYINAVYLNSFKRLGYFIIAQSPLPNTLDDFVLMLYQENCCCIVSLDDYQLKGTNNAAYLPAENQHGTYGSCTISSTLMDSKSAYSVRKLKIGHSSRFEKGMKIAHHFEYSGWKHDERIPKDVNMFVEFVQEVEEYATQLADEHSHVLVHCLTGSGRSGLFCAVSNLIQKMGQDRQVSVVNTLRQVRARRKTAIRNTEQLKFCYQAVYAYVKNYQV